jgi:hypothetical protein
MALWGWETIKRVVMAAGEADAFSEMDERIVLRWSCAILMFLFGIAASSFLYMTPPYLFWLPPFVGVGSQIITYRIVDGEFLGWSIFLMIQAFLLAFAGSLVPPLFEVAKNAIFSRL